MVLFGVSPLYSEVQPDTPKVAKIAEKFEPHLYEVPFVDGASRF